jgi:hypothetical protein
MESKAWVSGCVPVIFQNLVFYFTPGKHFNAMVQNGFRCLTMGMGTRCATVLKTLQSMGHIEEGEQGNYIFTLCLIF